MPEQPKTPSALAIPLWVIAVALLLIAGAVAFQGYLEVTRRNAGIARAASETDAAEKVVIPRPGGLRSAKPATTPVTVAKPSPLPPPRVVPPPLSSPRVALVPPSLPAAIPMLITNATETAAASRLPVPAIPVNPAVVVLPAFALDSNEKWITGRVLMSETPPAETLLPIDPLCGKMRGGQAAMTRFFIKGTNSGLGDVFVFISKGLEGLKYQPPPQPLLLEQEGCEFFPYVSAAQTGQRILVRNRDPFLHNVHPTPAVGGNREFNRAHLPGAPDLEFVWQQPELFLRIKCDVHPWMFAYIVLVDHPFFSVTDTNGNFRLPVPPVGEYVVTAVHRKAGVVDQRVSVRVVRSIEMLPLFLRFRF